MNRRDFTLLVGGAGLGILTNSSVVAQEAGRSFGRETVVRIAGDLASQEFRPPRDVLELFSDLGYDQYRDIRFRRELGFWVGEDRGFTLEPLHAGFIFKKPVELYVVETGSPVGIRYTSHLFDFGKQLKVPPIHDQPLFSGVRLRAPINTPDQMDEFAVFQGASYFRSLGQHRPTSKPRRPVNDSGGRS